LGGGCASARISKGEGYERFLRKRAGSIFGQERKNVKNEKILNFTHNIVSFLLQNAMKVVRKLLHELMGLCTELLYHQQDKVNEEAFVTICDLLIVFSKHMGQNKNLLPLVYEPDKNLQAQLSGFLTEKVFVDDDDDDVDENVKIEELHNRRNFLASFCKLVVYNVVNIRTAADMFKHYMKVCYGMN
jgi:hypothetical protein